MPDSVILLPCPFCGGPPSPFCRDTDNRGGELTAEKIKPDGSWCEAYVFCHECGTQGATSEGTVYGQDCLSELLDKAVIRWQTRNARHADLYKPGKHAYQPSAEYTVEQADSFF